MARKVLSLDGVWDVVFDEKESLGPDCFAKKAKTAKVNVPGVWEEARPFYDGAGYYRRTFKLPAGFAGRRLHLKFGAVNYYAEAWLNGTAIGEHEGGYSPFVFDVTKVAKEGDNELVVRVIDPPRNRRIKGFRSGAPLSQSDIPTWKAGWYFNFGGIWQSVELMATEHAWVDDVFVQPMPDLKTVKIDVTVINRRRAGAYDLTVAMAPKAKGESGGLTLSKKVKLKTGANTVSLKGVVAKARAWSPDDPFLYTATATLSEGGEDVDSTSVTCGLRHFTAADGVFMLNGKRIALRGFLQQGVYPRHIVFPATLADARKELMLLKRNGMNFIRAHLKPPPIQLDLADELGILLLEEPPIGWIENTEHTVERCKREVDELVRRDRNRPSVVMWCLLNEATHYRTFTPPQLEKFKKILTDQCLKNDPTRICIDNSGGELKGHEDSSTTDAYLPFETKTTPVHDLHAYCGVPVSIKALETYRTQAGGGKFKPDGVSFTSSVKKNGRNRRNAPALFVSEFGAFENPPDFKKVLGRYSAADKRVGLEDYAQHKSYSDSLNQRFRQAGLGKMFGTVDKFIRATQDVHCENARAIVSAMRANPRNSGWVFTQLADASGEIFGATDIWRDPRPWFKDMAEACQTPLVVPYVDKKVVAPGENVVLNLRIVNEDRQGETYTWKVTVRNEKGKAVLAEKSTTKARGWVQEVMEKTIAAPTSAGRYTVAAELRKGSKVVSSNYIRFTVIATPEVPCPRVGMFDMDNEILPALEVLGIPAIDKGGNNYRHKNNPCIYVPRAHHHLGLLSEYNQQLRRIVELGGVALVLEGQTPMLYDELLPKLVRMEAPMRNMVYMRPSPIWNGLPTSKGIMDYEFADVLAGRANARNNPEDVAALGGTSLCAGLCAHMWTGPEVYQWGSFIDVIPIGKGHVILSQFSLVQPAKTNMVARRLLANLIAYAASLVKKGNEEKLLSRCIDPVNK